MSADALKKILVVGESLTGKTALIRAFLDFDAENASKYCQANAESAVS
jgi:GTPase SAR1 family protein